MSTDQDQARLIAERVARRMSGGRSGPATESSSRASRINGGNGAPVSEELTAIRSGLHDLERKLDRVESKIGQGTAGAPIQSRARVIDFVSATPPPTVSPSIAAPPPPPTASVPQSQFVPATHSPWVRDFANPPSHPSEERFGIEEAAVSELVEFFENEKKCSVDPSGKPCDHCAMCSSRGF
jgi:hypothetical protein